MDLARAADIQYAVGSPETYRLLVVNRGWSGALFERWCGDTLERWCGDTLERGFVATDDPASPDGVRCL